LITFCICTAAASSLLAEEHSAPAPPAENVIVVDKTVSLRAEMKIPCSPDLTLLSAIIAAGGGNDLRSVTLIRGKRRTVFRLKKLIRQPETDPKLQPGDRIESGD
jgi:hypothetical protein